MASVYRAFDEQSKTTVALKIVEGSPENEARFLREANVLAGLKHPGIVRYTAHGKVSPGSLYMAMEWLEGEDLSTRLERGKLSEEESLRVATQVAEALAEVHARGVVHRDLKPENLFLVGKSLE